MGFSGKLQFKVFRSRTRFWSELFQEAADFASALGMDRVQNITTSCDSSDSLVTVWYWD